MDIQTDKGRLRLAFTGKRRFDCVVVGAGTAGICAAIQCGACGKKTLLVEKNGYPGGTITGAGIANPGLFAAWGRQIIAGIGYDLVRKTLQEEGLPLPDFSVFNIRKHYLYQVRINPLMFALIAEEALQQSGVEIAYHCLPIHAQETGEGVELVLAGKEELELIEAKAVVDCTGDANLAAMLKLPLQQSSLEEMQPATYSVELQGIRQEEIDWPRLERKFEEFRAAGLIRAEDLGWSVEGFSRRFIQAEGFNANHIHGFSPCDSRQKTRLDLEGRRAILRAYRFLKGERGFERLTLANFHPECGVRETRRICSCHDVTVDEYLSGMVYEDALNYSFYPVDLHGATGVSNRMLEEQTFPTIPARALMSPKSRRFFAAGRIIGSDHLAMSAVRVQATCMATGQSAGSMAVTALETEDVLSAEGLERIRDILRTHGAVVPPQP